MQGKIWISKSLGLQNVRINLILDKERVPYVVVHRGPKHRLIDATVNPRDLLNDRSLRLNGTYYIEKQIIPAIDRVFKILGVGNLFMLT